MTKKEAMRLLQCSTYKELATELGITPPAIYQWTDPIPKSAEDKVLAAAYKRIRGGKRGKKK